MINELLILDFISCDYLSYYNYSIKAGSKVYIYSRSKHKLLRFKEHDSEYLTFTEKWFDNVETLTADEFLKLNDKIDRWCKGCTADSKSV